MKKIALPCLVGLAAASIFAADPTPKDDVAAAIKKLEEKSNYAWKSTFTVPDDSPFRPTPTLGKTEKGGYTVVEMSLMDNEMKVVSKGDKGVASEDGKWKTFAEFDQAEGPARMIGAIARGVKTPAREASRLLGFSRDLKRDGEIYSAELTEEGAKELQKLGPGEEGPAITNANGSSRFWIINGELAKYEFKVKGTISFNGNEIQNQRTTAVEIKDVGTTTVTTPDAAKQMLK